MSRELLPCRRCQKKNRVNPNPKCVSCVTKNPVIYADVERLDEWRRVRDWRAARAKMGFEQRLAIGEFRGGYRMLTKDDQILCDQMTDFYVRRAKAKGKDVSTKLKRTPYRLAALSWLKSRRSEEARRIWAVKNAKSRSQDRVFERIDRAKLAAESEHEKYETPQRRPSRMKHTLSV